MVAQVLVLLGEKPNVLIYAKRPAYLIKEMKTTEVFFNFVVPLKWNLKMISDPGPFCFTKSSGSLTKMLSSGTLSVGLTDAISGDSIPGATAGGFSEKIACSPGCE